MYHFGLTIISDNTQVLFYNLPIRNMHVLHYYMMLKYQDDFQAVLSLKLLRLLKNTQVPFYDLLICHMHNLHYYMMLQ